MTIQQQDVIWFGPGWDFNTDKIFKVSGASPLIYLNKPSELKQNKSYYYKIHISNLTDMSISQNVIMSVLWEDSFRLKFDETNGQSSFGNQDGYIYFNSSPINNATTNNYINIVANNSFGSDFGIKDLELFELEWIMCGLSWINDNPDISLLNSRGLGNKNLYCNGWRYDNNSSAFIWYHQREANVNKAFSPAGGIPKEEKREYNYVNHLSRYIGFQDFNLSFQYTKGVDNGITTDENAGIRVYLSDIEPPQRPLVDGFDRYLDSSTLIAYLSGEGSYSADYIGLVGNKYVVFVGDTAALNKDVVIAISNIEIRGGYSDNNNKLFDVTLPNIVVSDLGNSLFSTIVGTGKIIRNNTDPDNIKTLPGSNLIPSELTSKIGNSYFKSGIWENGVWNSGYRNDDDMREMHDVLFSVKTFSDIKWVVRISGPSESINASSISGIGLGLVGEALSTKESLKIGDKISISNIVGVDINDNRKILRGLYTIIRIGDEFIDIDIETTFPLRRIERDSKNHRIMITRNVWLSGGFLNGYFKGIWNYGLFKGYPLITEMLDTHWIDGIYDGGHFKGVEYLTGNFISTSYEDGLLSIKTDLKHNLAVNDIIEIILDDDITVNTEYNGEHRVIKIKNSFEVILDQEWGQSVTDESGTYKTGYSTGLIQNMDFKSNNVSRLTSNKTLNSLAVFNYNSWLDVTYYEDTAVNIGKPQTVLNKVSRKYFSENNLYGYPTNDVLSSSSNFRDSFSLNKRLYSLGTKFKIFSDYIGESSEFKDFFGPSGDDLDLFLEKGWSFSIPQNSTSSITPSLTFDRTESLGGFTVIQGEELKMMSSGQGGVLDLDEPLVDVLGRDRADIARNRYTLVEFDLVEYNSGENEYRFPIDSQFGGNTFSSSLSPEPTIHFDNINKTSRLENVELQSGETQEIIQLRPSTYLPIYKNINHIITPRKRKVEYFFNKRHLSMNIRGSGLLGELETSTIIDNLKLLEINMVPFFKYFRDDNINKSIQIPFTGVSPYIDYTDNDFDFIDNIDINLGTISLNTGDIDFGNSGIDIGIIDVPEPPSDDEPDDPSPGDDPNLIIEIPVLFVPRILGSDNHRIRLDFSGIEFLENAYMPIRLNINFELGVNGENITFSETLSINFNGTGVIDAQGIADSDSFVNGLISFRDSVFSNSVDEYSDTYTIGPNSFEIDRVINNSIILFLPNTRFTTTDGITERYSYINTDTTASVEVYGNIPNEPNEPSLSVTPESLTLPNNNSGNGSFIIVSNGTWTVSKSAPWINDLTVESGEGNANYSFSYQGNSKVSERDGTITVSQVGGNLQATYTLTQPGDQPYLVISNEGQVSSATREVSSNGGNYTIEVASNTNWSIDTNAPSWLSVSPLSSFGTKDVVVSRLQNTTSGPRVGIITVSVDNGNLSVTQEVTQTSSGNDEETLFLHNLSSGSTSALACQSQSTLSYYTNNDIFERSTKVYANFIGSIGANGFVSNGFGSLEVDNGTVISGVLPCGR